MRAPTIAVFLLHIVLSCATVLAARLELRPVTDPVTEMTLQVGDEVDVELWIDSEGELLSGAAVFLSFDTHVFALAAEDRNPLAAGFQPFAPGSFLNNGEIYRNDLLDEDDPAATASGTQLDFSVVRATGQGQGPVASFRLRALAPAARSSIRIDESGVRETRVFLPDGSHAPFRFITPLTVTVQGITLRHVPQRIVLPRGSVDDTSLPLDALVFDPLYTDEEITWSFSSTAVLQTRRDPDTGVLRLQAPVDRSGWEQLTLTAVNPAGQSATATIQVFIAAPPQLPEQAAPLELAEDQTLDVALDDWVTDPDTPASELRWTATCGPMVDLVISDTPAIAHLTPRRDWSGSGFATFVVTDEFDFADTLQVAFQVEPVNDPPRFAFSPNIRLTDGRLDSSLVLSELVTDVEDGTPALSWSGADQVTLVERSGRLVIGNTAHWTGTEQILLQATDSGALTATAPLTVTVVPSLPPDINDPPTRQGLVAGSSFVLQLDPLVADPDDGDEDLLWRVSGQQSLRVLLSGSRAVRVEAPPDFSGVETLTLTVTDPTGGRASFQLLVFAAPEDGSPVLAALPQITVPVDGVNTSLDLDDYVFAADAAAQQLDFLVPARDDVELRVDPQTHVLTITPRPAARPGTVEVEIRVVDGSGHEATQTLRIQLTGEAPQPEFTLLAADPILLEGDAGAELHLDELVSGSVDVQAIDWSTSGQQFLDVVLDTDQRTAHFARRQADWHGEEQITLIARYPELPVQTVTVTVTVTAPQSSAADLVPQLATLPALQVQAGSLDQSLDLDEFLTAADAAQMRWQVAGQMRLQAQVDPQSHRLLISAPEDWSGQETLAVTGYDPAGNRVQGTVTVQVSAPLSALELRATLEVALFAGSVELRLAVRDLLLGDADPAQLTWTASGPVDLTVTYDDAREELVLTPVIPWQSAAIITLAAADGQGREAVTHVLAQVHPVDGSIGVASPDFQLAVIAHPLQPDYVDVYVLCPAELSRPPVLRLQDGTWQNLTLEPLIPGIWQSHHVSAPGTRNTLEFVALTIDASQQVLRSDFVLPRPLTLAAH